MVCMIFVTTLKRTNLFVLVASHKIDAVLRGGAIAISFVVFDGAVVLAVFTIFHVDHLYWLVTTIQY